jgi:hypothetical protein
MRCAFKADGGVVLQIGASVPCPAFCREYHDDAASD